MGREKRSKFANDAKTTADLASSLAQSASQIDVINKFQVSIESFPRLTGETDDALRIQRAINSISTSEFTEAIPTNGTARKVVVPAGRYSIYSTIKIPSYVKFEGAGRHATIFDSFITNGDPLIQVSDITDPLTNRAFYTTLEGFSINGKRNNCQGIKIYRTSRWILRDIIIDRTAGEGLNVYSGFLGEIYSLLTRACGDSTRYSVLLTGTNSSSGGSHAVSFFGGELNGGTGSVNGLFLEYGNSVTLNGTTIEGFTTGIGVTAKNPNSFMINGGYFELNKENIVEIGNTLGSTYTNNIFADLAVGARGHIGITYAQGCTISGNYFQGDATKVKIFDATADTTGKLHMSQVRANYSTIFPITISASILASAKTGGTVIETYNANNQVRVYGDHQFNDIVEVSGDLKPTGGIKNIGGFTRSNIVGNNGSPESVVIADPGSICLNGSDSTDRSTVAYLKANGVNNAVGWLPIQGIQAGTTASRPTVTTVGYCYFDATLSKPIWWSGTFWKDSAGTTV
jgi:hypothetical protein